MTPPDATVAAPKTLMTVDEYWDFVNRPENENKFLELRRGEVIELPRPTRLHGITCLEIGRLLGNHVAKLGKGYLASNDAGVILEERPGTVVGPDVAYYTDAETYEDVTPKWGDVPPVLAVEVLSPNDKPTQVNEKVVDYLRSGVKLVWLVDYEERKVTVFRPGRSPEIVRATDELTGGDELPGFSCRVADFFKFPALPST
jgi:Uma2 family endonuclease